VKESFFPSSFSSLLFSPYSIDIEGRKEERLTGALLGSQVPFPFFSFFPLLPPSFSLPFRGLFLFPPPLQNLPETSGKENEKMGRLNSRGPLPLFSPYPGLFL